MAAHMRIAAAIVIAGFGVVETASATEPKSLGRFRDWQAYTADEQGKTICFAMTAPKKSEGNYTNRDPAFLMVTRRPSENVFDDVSAIAGYQYKLGSRPTFSIGSKSYAADAVKDVAWPKPRETRSLVAAMKAGSTLELKGVSSRGTDTRDEFSLLGFTAALNAVAKSCPKP